jgi:ABC-type transport system substrate-binding protein
MSSSGTGHMSRRRFVAVLLAASTGSLLQACAPAATPAPPAPTVAPTAIAAAKPAASSAPAPATSAQPVASPAAKPAAAASPVVGAAPNGQASIRFADDADSLLAGIAGSARSGWIFSSTANGLTRLRQPDLAVDKDLAQEWTISPDGKTYTFTLNPSIKWHDGQPFSADDILFTYQLFSHPSRSAPLPPDLAGIEGANLSSRARRRVFRA